MGTKGLLSTPTVLCIDDDFDITEGMKRRLGEFELGLLTANTGEDGLWLALDEEPDLIVTDLRMPNGEGDYVVECLKGRADTCDIPIIALTGCRDRELERWMLTLGVKHYLHKPPRWPQLLEAMRQYIDLRPAAAC